MDSVYGILVLVILKLNYFHFIKCILVGPYALNITSASVCSNVSASITYDIKLTKLESGDHIYVTADLQKYIGPISASVYGYRLINNEYIKFFHMKSRRVCDWLYSGTLINAIKPTPDKRCGFEKGPFSFTVNDPNKIVHTFVGKYLLYGKYKGRMMTNVGKTTTACIDFMAEVIQV